MDRHLFAKRVIHESDYDDLLAYVRFLEQTDRNHDEYLARDATYMIGLANVELKRRRASRAGSASITREPSP